MGLEPAVQALEPIHDPFTEPFGGGTGIRFQTRNLRLDGAGKTITRLHGGPIRATMEVLHDCGECGGAINQIIVGLGGEASAQACVWDGGQSSFGWQPVSFMLDVPDVPGVYYVRTRYAQGWSCADGIGWWSVDRPAGPTAESDIGAIIVAGKAEPPPPPAPMCGEELVVNGSFEAPAIPQQTWRYLPSIPGWNLSFGHSIELQNHVAGTPFDGEQHCELDSDASSGIYQDIPTVPGQAYTFRLMFSARPGQPSYQNVLRVLWDHRAIARLSPGPGEADTVWHPFVQTVVASGTLTRIEIQDDGPSDSYGGYIDAVSVTPAEGVEISP